MFSRLLLLLALVIRVRGFEPFMMAGIGGGAAAVVYGAYGALRFDNRYR
jgi:hypothetical protein